MRDGLSNTEIATRLYSSEATVKTHINNLFAKTVSYAFRHGVAHPR
ncbi:response regulator transcription factor [Nonomuraea sp. NPDC050153]